MNRKPQGRQHDRDYLARIHDLPCFLDATGLCIGPIEADHVGQRPQGRKCDDTETIPLCKLHHAQRHAMSGYFRNHTREQMRAFKAMAIELTRLALGWEAAA